MKLTIIRIKPNPAGKDRPLHGGPSPTQLAAEWVDFRNDTGQAVSLNTNIGGQIAQPSLWATSACRRIRTLR